MDKLKTWDEQYARLFDDSSTCVSCGEYVPEGRQVCTSCEKKGRNARSFLMSDDFIIGYDHRKDADTSCLTVSRQIGTKRVVVNTLYGEEAEILYSKLVK